MSQLAPRFSGNAVQTGKHWTWELLIRIGGNELEPLVMANKELFISKDAALANMKQHLPEIMRLTCEAMGLPKPEGVYDLNKGTVEKTEDWLKADAAKDSAT